MVNRYTDIFQNLKDFSIKPPKWLFRQIWLAIKKNQSDKAITSPEPDQEPEENEEGYTQHEIDIFKSLQEYSVTPPVFSSLNIKDDGKEKKISSPNNVFTLKNISRIAAAILIIVSTTWGLYHITQSKKGTEAIVLKPAPATSNNNELALSNSNDQHADISSSNNVNGNPIKPQTTNTKSIVKISGRQLKGRNYQVPVKLVDNDVLLTLVSYKYNDYMPLVSAMEKKKKIQLGQFSYINVSDKMNALLKKMYATKRNNKPTRKARKIKAQLKKWKKADEKEFDQEHNNPIDIIDLSEFILN